MAEPAEILAVALRRAEASGQRLVADALVSQRVNLVCRNLQNRAPARLLLAALLAKIHSPGVDIRRPYTEIGTADSYSGRTYDERYLPQFITRNRLPLNPTTAFLTPAFCTGSVALTTDLNLSGRPPAVYAALLDLLDDVYGGRVAPDDLLAELIRHLLVVRDETEQRMKTLLANLGTSQGAVPLSAERIVTLVQQHLANPRSSRLPGSQLRNENSTSHEGRH